MATFKVLAASHKKDVTTPMGEFQVISLSLDENGVTSQAEWFAKKTTAIPIPSMVLEGTLEKGDYGLKFRKAQPSGSFGGGFKPEDPERQRKIVRQHSQEMALRYLALMDPETRDAYLKVQSNITQLTDWFEADVSASASSPPDTPASGGDRGRASVEADAAPRAVRDGKETVPDPLPLDAYMTHVKPEMEGKPDSDVRLALTAIGVDPTGLSSRDDLEARVRRLSITQGRDFMKRIAA